MHHESGPAAKCAHQFDAAAVRRGDLADEPEADAEAAIPAVRNRAAEALENALLIHRRDADALILDRQSGFARALFDRDLHLPALAVLQRIGYEVGDHGVMRTSSQLPSTGAPAVTFSS